MMRYFACAVPLRCAVLLAAAEAVVFHFVYVLFALFSFLLLMLFRQLIFIML